MDKKQKKDEGDVKILEIDPAKWEMPLPKSSLIPNELTS